MLPPRLQHPSSRPKASNALPLLGDGKVVGAFYGIIGLAFTLELQDSFNLALFFNLC
jgi:hypothetical protein